MNPLKPEMMTPDERLAELGQILARGLIRLHARKASSLSADKRDSFVDLYQPTELMTVQPIAGL